MSSLTEGAALESSILRDALCEYITARGGRDGLGLGLDAEIKDIEAGVFEYVATRYRSMGAQFKAMKHAEVCNRVLAANRLLMDISSSQDLIRIKDQKRMRDVLKALELKYT